MFCSIRFQIKMIHVNVCRCKIFFMNQRVILWNNESYRCYSFLYFNEEGLTCRHGFHLLVGSINMFLGRDYYAPQNWLYSCATHSLFFFVCVCRGVGVGVCVCVLGRDNWIHLAHRPSCTVTLNSNLAILKTWIFFWIRVKELCL